MKPISPLALCLFVMVIVTGCASTEVADRKQLVTERIPRPNNILVYDFVATQSDVPADSALASHSTVHRASQTSEHIATGRRVGAEISTKLVEEIRSMGMPAERASGRTRPQISRPVAATPVARLRSVIGPNPS